MKQKSSVKVTRLLLHFAELSDREGKEFILGMNQLLFASAPRKQAMRTAWMDSMQVGRTLPDISVTDAGESENIKDKHEAVFGKSRDRG